MLCKLVLLLTAVCVCVMEVRGGRVPVKRSTDLLQEALQEERVGHLILILPLEIDLRDLFHCKPSDAVVLSNF